MDTAADTSENAQTVDKTLLEPYEYISKIPGKQIRTKLAQAFNYWLNISPEKVEAVAEITEMLHNASLLVDDIEDSSTLRRGIPVAHNIYGIPTTLNAANLVYFLALQKTQALGHPKASELFANQLVELHKGQGLDIYWRDSYQCPSLESYKKMVIQKTGGLFGLAVQLMQLFSHCQRNFKPLLDLLGLYFQIRDDYANLYSKEYESAKSYCEDLSEGKFSYLTVYAIKTHPSDQLTMNILRQRPTDNNVKRFCVQHLEKLGAFEHTRQILSELESSILQEVADCGGNTILLGIIKELKKIYSPQLKDD